MLGRGVWSSESWGPSKLMGVLRHRTDSQAGSSLGTRAEGTLWPKEPSRTAWGPMSLGGSEGMGGAW